MSRKALLRDNTYYLDRLAVERPDIHVDLLSGKIGSVAEALHMSGIKRRRTGLQQLTSAWSKASPSERDVFRQQIGCMTAPAGQSAASGGARNGGPIHVDRRLTPAAIARITAIMARRKMRMGQVMGELGFSPLNASVGIALSRGTTLRPEVLERLEDWLNIDAVGSP